MTRQDDLGQNTSRSTLVEEENKKTWKYFMEYLGTFYEGIKFASLTNFATFCCAKGEDDPNHSLILTDGLKGVLDFSCVSFSLREVRCPPHVAGGDARRASEVDSQASFTRRERALSCLGSLKGTMFALFLMFKTWDRDQDTKFVEEVEDLMLKLLDDITCYLRSSTRNPEAGHVIYDGFSALAQKMKDFLPRTGYSKPGEGGLSRMQMYLRDLMTHFEGVRAVRDSETPIGLRLFCFALIHISPILLAPYWNHFCGKQNNSEMPSQYGCESGYFVGIFYVLIVLTLYRVQVELENPFDGNGDDDIKWNLWRAQLENMSSYGADGPTKRALRAEKLYQAQEGS
eukprot:766380-Hanusia_phi.AAC.2